MIPETKSRSRVTSQYAAAGREPDRAADDREPDLPMRPTQPPWDRTFDRPIPVGEIARAFSGHVFKYTGTLLRAFGAFFVASTLAAMIPLSTKFVIDYLLPSRNYALLWMTAGFVLVVFLLMGILNVLGNHLLIWTSLHIVFDVRSRLFQHLQWLHLAFYEREQSGKLVSKLINDATALQTLVQQALPVLSVNVFTVVITFLLMSLLSAKLTFFAMIVLPVYMVISYFFRARLYRRSREVRERNSVVAGNVNEVITGIKVVKSFGMQDQEHRRFVNMIRENLSYEIDLGTVQAIRSNTLQCITGFAQAMVLVIGGMAVMSISPTAMTVGDYVAFLAFLSALFGPMQSIANLAIQVIHARTGLERILHILNIRPKVVDRPHARKIDKIVGSVKLEDVSFSYDSGGPVLRNINIEAKPGEVVALVGPSGSGKSTVVGLLTRFYDVTDGRIMIDGVDIRNVQLRSYHHRVGIVLQEPFLFSGTIYDNICYGSGRARYEEVAEAARQANALDFINELPSGMETQVGERGQLLSGGQRQRIAIARALLKDPDILILDEATSSLDTQSERLVQEALDRLMRGRTVFVIAHRLTTIHNADKIVVLSQGRVTEEGNHASLMAANGLYASLYAENLSLALNGDAGQELSDKGVSVNV